MPYVTSSDSEAEVAKVPKAAIEKDRTKTKRVLSEAQKAVLAAARKKRLENCAAKRRAKEEAAKEPATVPDAAPVAGIAKQKPRAQRKPTRRTVVHVPAPEESSSSEEEIVYVQAPRRRKKKAAPKRRVVVQQPSSSDESSDDEEQHHQAPSPGFRWV
jgi:hypothetical protein